MRDEWRACLHASGGDNASLSRACGRRATCRNNAALAGRAWVTMLNGNAPNYTAQALVQALSVRMFSCLPHTVLVTRDVDAAVRTRLAAAGSRVQEVTQVHWRHHPPGVIGSYQWLLTKLQLWNLTAYRQVAFLDADVFMVHAEAEALFEHCADAAADLCAGLEWSSVSHVNGGVLVVRPSAARFAALLHSLDRFVKPNAIYPDMAFLRHEYGLRNATAYGPGLQVFNVPRGVSKAAGFAADLFHTCPELARRAYQYQRVQSRVVLRRIRAVRLWHACGRHKLEVLPRCPADGGVAGGAHPFCASRVLQLFQWLHAQANPCVAAGASAGACVAAPGCHWCGDSSRCVPREWDCYRRDSGTIALDQRMTQPKGRGMLRPGWCSLTCDPACCAAVRAGKAAARRAKRGARGAQPGARAV